MQAANRYEANVDDILLKFNSHLSYREQHSRLGKFNQQITDDRYTHLLIELATYYLGHERFEIGFYYLMDSLESYVRMRNDYNIIRCVGLFEKYRSAAPQEQTSLYKKLYDSWCWGLSREYPFHDNREQYT